VSCNASFGSRQDRFGIRVVSRCNDDREGTELARTIFLAQLAALAIGTTIAVYVGRKVSGGTRAVLDRAQAIARGDLTASRVDIESEDELGKATIALNGKKKSQHGSKFRHAVHTRSEREQARSYRPNFAGRSE
jgi:methyl-accepting chemotaxis protein